jgi:hypothetical protein
MLSSQDKVQFKNTIQSNKHEIFVLSIDEMDAVIRSSTNGAKPAVQKAWEKIKSKVGLGANYFASADDARTMTKLVADLGSFGARAYVKNYGGKPHIILKGHAGLRKLLTATKYGMKNPKVVTMGLGKVGAIKAAKSGGILTVVLLTAYRVVDYVLTDEATLTQLVGTLATDIVKVGITTGASIAAATLVGATTVAIGPIAAVVVIGFFVSASLDYLDKKYGITDRVIAGLDEISDSVSEFVDNKKRELQNSVERSLDSVIDYVLESAERIAIDWTKQQLDKYFSMIPAVR